MNITTILRKSLWVVLFIFFTGGCVDQHLPRMYSGHELPQSEVCFLLVPGSVAITALDDLPTTVDISSYFPSNVANNKMFKRRVVFYSKDYSHDSNEIVELLPGKHKLAINLWFNKRFGKLTKDFLANDNYSWDKDVSFDFMCHADHIYAIKPGAREIQSILAKLEQRRSTQRWDPYIEDITNSKKAKENVLPKISPAKDHFK